MNIHECNKEILIEKLKEEIMNIKTRLAVVESTITNIKNEIEDVNETMDKMSDKVQSNFDDINKKILTVLGFTVATLVGVIITVVTK